MKMSPSRAPAMTRTCLGLPTLEKTAGRTVSFHFTTECTADVQTSCDGYCQLSPYKGSSFSHFPVFRFYNEHILFLLICISFHIYIRLQITKTTFRGFNPLVVLFAHWVCRARGKQEVLCDRAAPTLPGPLRRGAAMVHAAESPSSSRCFSCGQFLHLWETRSH